MRLRSVSALWLLLVSPANLGWAQKPAKTLSESTADLRRQMKELEPKLEQLETLGKEYCRRERELLKFEPLLALYDELWRESAGGTQPPPELLDRIGAMIKRLDGPEYKAFSRLLVEDNELRGEIYVRRQRLYASIDEISQLRSRIAISQGLQALEGVLQTGKPTTVAQEASEIEDAKKVMREVLEFKKRLQPALGRDTDAFALARKRARWNATKRRLLTGGLLLIVPLWVLMRYRKQPSGQKARPRPREPLSLRRPAPAPPESGTLPAGAVVGGSYRIVRELGQGSLGTVYEALDLEQKRSVAIKRIREELQSGERDLERFLSEARSVAALRHKNLAEIFSVFLDHERILLACELIAGKPLSRLLEERGRLSLREIKTLVPQMTAALEHAHRQDVLHGDLKPSNVMILPGGQVKVMDFSLTILARKTLARLTWEEAGASLENMAPEQELGEAGPQSDVYSLGILFYLMLTGRKPFQGSDCLAQKKAMRFVLPSQVLPGLGDRADSIVRTALQVDLSKRFPTAYDIEVLLNALPDEVPRS